MPIQVTVALTIKNDITAIKQDPPELMTELNQYYRDVNIRILRKPVKSCTNIHKLLSFLERQQQAMFLL